MSNPHTGEIGFESGGKSYVLKLGTYAQAVLERRTKVPMSKFFKRKDEEWGVDDILSVLYAGLYRQHKLTEEQVADIIDDLGMERVGVLIADAVKAAYPEAGSAAADPPRAAAENGTTTTS